MAINLGSAYGKVTIDAWGVKRGVSEATQSLSTLEIKAKQLGQTLENVGRSMTLAVSIPLALMAKEAVMAASSYEESLNKVNVVFEKNSQEIIKWSENAAKKLGMTQQQALEAASTFGNLFDTIGMNADQNAEMSKSLVQLATDLASMHNISIEEALLKLRAGLVGEVEPLRTVGVLLNQAAVEAKAFELGLTDANGQLSEAAKVQARYALILEQTTNAQGDFERTSGSLANQLRTLKGNWGDTLKILGDQLLPIVTKLLVKLNEFLDWFNNAPPHIQKIVGAMLLLAFVIGPLLIVLGKMLPLAFSGVTKNLNPFSFGIFEIIGTIVKLIGVAALIVKVLGALGIATGPVGVAILSVQAAIAGVGLSILSVVGPILLIIGAIALLYFAFKNNFMGIRTTAEQLWFIIKYYFREGWQAIVTATKEGLASMGSGLAEGFASMQERFMRFADWLREIWNKIREFLANSFRNVNWSQIGHYIIQGIASGLLGGIPLIVSAAQRAGQAALDALRRALDSRSPSRKTFLEGMNASRGFVQGMDAAMNPSVLNRITARPIEAAANSTNQSVTMNFANGVTFKQVQQMLEMNNDQLLNKLNAALGGA